MDRDNRSPFMHLGLLKGFGEFLEKLIRGNDTGFTERFQGKVAGISGYQKICETILSLTLCFSSW